MAQCFKCRTPIPRDEVAHGPICGPADEHPDCRDVPWHYGCRQEWLDDLAVWADIARRDSNSPSDV